MFLETILWSKKIKKKNIDHNYPFILTPKKAFVGKPGGGQNQTLHVDIQMEFMGQISTPYLRGRFDYQQVTFYDKNADLYDMTGPIVELREQGFIGQKTKVRFYDIHLNQWVEMSLGELMGERNAPVVQYKGVPVKDPSERQAKSWVNKIRYDKISPEELWKKREENPYFNRWGESA